MILNKTKLSKRNNLLRNINYDLINEKNIWKIIKLKKFSILMVAISAFIFIFAVQVFLNRAQVLSTGLSSISQFINIAVPSTQQYFSLMYFAFNIPMFIIFWKSIKRSFFVLTLFFMVFQTMWGLIIGIPQINDFLLSITQITPYKLNSPEGLISQETWPYAVYALMGGLLVGVSTGIAWKYGGSTGGTDIVSYYFSTKKKIVVTRPMMIIAFSICIISLIGISFFRDLSDPIIKARFIIQILGTFIYIVASLAIVKMIYPKYQKVLLTIHSSQNEKIIEELKKMKYWHGYSIYKGKSGYTSNDITEIKTVAFLLESKTIIEMIKLWDEKAWISVVPVRKIVGSLNSNKVD